MRPRPNARTRRDAARSETHPPAVAAPHRAVRARVRHVMHAIVPLAACTIAAASVLAATHRDGPAGLPAATATVGLAAVAPTIEHRPHDDPASRPAPRRALVLRHDDPDAAPAHADIVAAGPILDRADLRDGSRAVRLALVRPRFAGEARSLALLWTWTLAGDGAPRPALGGRVALALPVPDLDLEDPPTARLVRALLDRSGAPSNVDPDDDAPDPRLARCLTLAARLADRTFADCLREHLVVLDALADLPPPCSDWCAPPEPSYVLCGACLWLLATSADDVEHLRSIAADCFRRALAEHQRLIAFCLGEDEDPRRPREPDGAPPVPGDAPGVPGG